MHKFQIIGDRLTGHGVLFDVGSLKLTGEQIAVLVNIANVIYQHGRESVLLSYDDRFDLSCTVDVLRALAVVMGPSATSDRHRRTADIIARMLQAQREGS